MLRRECIQEEESFARKTRLCSLQPKLFSFACLSKHLPKRNLCDAWGPHSAVPYGPWVVAAGACEKGGCTPCDGERLRDE
jgi:hypothetical protein